MKVLIINPPAYEGTKFVREGRCEQRLSSFQYVMVPISLPSIAGLLRAKGHTLKIIDTTVESISTYELVERIKEFKPGLIICNLATATFTGDIEFCSWLKQQTKSHITAIGTHVTSLPQESLEVSELDSVIKGEPEKSALDLANALESGSDLSGVKGISYKKGKEIIHNENQPFIEDLDSLPFPARDLIHNERYVMPFSNRPYTLLVASRGCTHHCIYCTARQYYGQHLRMRSAANVVDEAEEIINKFGIKDITMWSDTFTLNRDFVVAVCNEIIKRGLKFNWMANSRVDRVDYEMLKLMKKSGCTILSFGVETGVQEILNNIRKGTTTEQAQEVFKWTRELGIETIAHVVLGLPGENKETVKKTIKFIKKINPDFAQFYCAIPFPGTEYYDLAKSKGWITTQDWTKYEINQPIVSTPQLSEEQLRKAKDKAFLAFYLRPTYIIRTFLHLKNLRELPILIRQGFNFFRSWVLDRKPKSKKYVKEIGSSTATSSKRSSP